MKFVKLLDPAVLPGNDISALGFQQRIAAEQFPELVLQSNLHYWRPGDPIKTTGDRCLLGLAASWDLRDLRLADLVEELLRDNRDVRVDVFNVEDWTSVDQIVQYFPGFRRSHYSTPIAGWWQNGAIEQVECGVEAKRLIVKRLGLSLSAEDSVFGLNPPDPRFML